LSPVQNQHYGTGRRKTSTARVFLRPGTGNFIVNNKPFEQYFFDELHRMLVRQPLQASETLDKFDLLVLVEGGGMHGQAGAVQHGIARALVRFNADLRGVLKKAGFLRRDPRMKERKKYGQPGARKRFQFSKR
jgi:small subunit ribosomal protein S9